MQEISVQAIKFPNCPTTWLISKDGLGAGWAETSSKALCLKNLNEVAS